jgi:hypothetical protein
MCLNEHDEIMSPCVPDKIEQLNTIVNNTVEFFRPYVPMLSIEWHNNMESWAAK